LDETFISLSVVIAIRKFCPIFLLTLALFKAIFKIFGSLIVEERPPLLAAQSAQAETVIGSTGANKGSV